MQVYRHTQIGYIILAFMAVAAAVMVPIVFTSGAIALGAGVCIGVVLVLLLFGTLSVEIRDEKLVFWFGLGLIRKSISLSEIADCSVNSFPWYYGWGIRYTPQGWLYNVSGFTAIRVMLKNGKRLQIGTDDADALCNVVTNAIRRTGMSIEKQCYDRASGARQPPCGLLGPPPGNNFLRTPWIKQSS